jgi:hypothetical protein
MSEIKGIDQIFPKKTEESTGSWKLWSAAGVVALLAAGYAVFPGGGTSAPASVASPPVSQTTPAASAAAIVTPQKKVQPAEPVKPATVAPVEDVKTTRKQESRRLQQQKVEVSQSVTPEAKPAVKPVGGRGCDCDTAELNLPAQCPDASCRQCKATCGIPGN